MAIVIPLIIPSNYVELLLSSHMELVSTHRITPCSSLKAPPMFVGPGFPFDALSKLSFKKLADGGDQ